ncbi:adenosylcobinamide-phosphate synthase CbiB [Palaeococcus ferrophilus]|uniref:adenosylcobinamide-phosphate synthase CbiB n=1 Tax=Palaeococcus ferrophilus TaxID=83868 RepID=UPI00064F8E56|nr:adenosylcobinamide-phosphate synthase CbiB [Palaeococcus ferrophilus]
MTLLIVASLLWDFILGEPPSRLHPVVWFGRVAGYMDALYKRRSPIIDFIAGLFTAGVVVAFALTLSFLPLYAPSPLNYLLAIYLLKSSFAIRSLHEHVSKTAVDNIEERRKAVSMIVSRDVSNLDEAYLNSAAIESLAENLNDSVIAPLFYLLLFGLPGAMVYRAVNTLDAMLGYMSERYEYFGKFSARLDDILNFIPARITVLLYLPLGGRRVLRYWRLARFKINSDKPIAAMGAVLGVWLEKGGVYRFPGREPGVEDIKRALRVSTFIVAEWVLITFSLLSTGVCPCLNL